MNFLINNTTASANTARKTLEGNQIHKVLFKGCEAAEFVGKDETKYRVLKMKFENEEGAFEDVIYEPTEADFKRTPTDFGYDQPSGVEYMITKLRHLIAAVRPDLDAEIEAGKKSISAPDWNGLRDLMVRATNKGKDIEVEIKLLKNKNGYAVFPRFFLGLSKEGNVYIKKGMNFIGNGLYFTDKEKVSIEMALAAKPTDMAAPEVKKSNPIVASIASDDFDDIDL